jgi:hypothetical protein
MRISHPPKNQSDLDMMIVGSRLGHYPLNHGEKNPSPLDYFSGRFTFKIIRPSAFWGEP